MRLESFDAVHYIAPMQGEITVQPRSRPEGALVLAHALSRFCSWLIFMVLLEQVQSRFGGALPIAFLILARRIPALLGAHP
jgi:hypothetical protein